MINRNSPRPASTRASVASDSTDNSPETREAWLKQGTIAMGMSIDQFDRFLREEIVKWAKVVKASGAKVD